MDRIHYEEMASNLENLIREHEIQDKKIYLFGHCNATEELIGLLLEKGFSVAAILDNNPAKIGKRYRGIPIQTPEVVLSGVPEETLVCIVARAYAAMADQLRHLGYEGQIRRLTEYDSYAEYSLSEETILRKKARAERGCVLLQGFEQKYPGCFKILCPFAALGDIYLMASYLPYFLQKRGIIKCVVGVIGKACADVVRIFGDHQVEIFSQKDMDETIQAALYTGVQDFFIPHQDRPYVVNLHKALHVKCIPLEQIYCCGVFGLSRGTKPYVPCRLRQYEGMEQIEKGRAVILSPYAKSVTVLDRKVWDGIVDSYRAAGYQCFTNVAGDEKALPGTMPITPAISEIQSVVERAGTFIGIRSGICDVLREASCRKVALYPDYNYCDTKWKAIDIYWLEGWENIVVGEGFKWEID